MGCLASLRIDLSDGLDNPGDSLHLKGCIDPIEYAVGDKHLRLSSGASYDVMLTNAGDGILATGIVRGTAEGECDRCLDTATFEVAGEIEEYFLFEEPADAEAYEDGFELVGIDRTIDLGVALSDAVVMDTPFVVLCQEDCKGLCSTCGANLNQGDCGCVARAEDEWADSDENPFAALKGLTFD